MFKPVLNQLTAILAQSEEDASRFKALGATADRVQVLGNIKFDLQMHVQDKPDCAQLQAQWGDARTVVLAASTHEDEEKQWLSRLPRLKEAIPDILLLIAPRHPERFQPVYQLSASMSFKTGLRSQPETVNADLDVVVLDCMGELLNFYQLSDYAFVGGSLVPIGGHNVLEPIAMQAPVFCGPFMNNSKAICRDLCEANAMVIAEDADALMESLVAMYQTPGARAQQVENASAVLEMNRGSLVRYMERVQQAMSERV
jgi:3-deoxy-D-manno-octulosonic-acid transferase